MNFETGPFLQTACFCETVIEDKTGALSLIRIIDTLTHTAIGQASPDQMPPINHILKLVLMMKSGQARGRHELVIKVEKPSGLKEDLGGISVHFEGEDKGHNIVTELNIAFTQEGLYWFHIYLEDDLWTSIPLRLKYSRITAGSGTRIP
jgi:hypothetical protein